MTAIRLLQVGMGGWGRDWNHLLAQHPELATTVAYVDMQAGSLRELQAEAGVAPDLCYRSLEAALAQAGAAADAVLVTTQVAHHVPVALAALEAGKHVLVEKPFAPSLAAARQAVSLAGVRGRVLMVSQNYRFFPAVQAAARLVREAALGPVTAVTVEFRKYANKPPRGTNAHYELVQPLLMDMSIHHFDLMRYVLDQEPVSVYCRTWNPAWSNFTEAPSAVATITFDGGAVVSYAGSWISTGAPTSWAGTWQIECKGGVIHWTSRGDGGPESDTLALRPHGKRARRVPLPALPYADRAGALAAFGAATRDGTEPPASGRDNLRSLGLMFAAIDAAASGQVQQVQPLT